MVRQNLTYYEIVRLPSFPVHANRYISTLQLTDPFVRGKLTPLIGIHYFQLTIDFQCPVEAANIKVTVFKAGCAVPDALKRSRGC